MRSPIVVDDNVSKFNKTRNNLLLVVIFSTINVFLTIFEADLSFLFSATFPVFSVAFGQGIAEELGNNIFLIIGIIIAFVSILIYGIFYLLSKKHKIFILIALIMFSSDTLLLLWVISLNFASGSNPMSLIIDLLFHVWIIYSLGVGVKAWSALKKEKLVDNIVEIATVEEKLEEVNEEVML